MQRRVAQFVPRHPFNSLHGRLFKSMIDSSTEGDEVALCFWSS